MPSLHLAEPPPVGAAIFMDVAAVALGLAVMAMLAAGAGAAAAAAGAFFMQVPM